MSNHLEILKQNGKSFYWAGKLLPKKYLIRCAELYSFCKTQGLNVIGLMCIPPLEKSPDIFFNEMNTLSENLNLKELSMGMSSDYLEAIKNSATYVRIGSNIFGERS